MSESQSVVPVVVEIATITNETKPESTNVPSASPKTSSNETKQNNTPSSVSSLSVLEAKLAGLGQREILNLLSSMTSEETQSIVETIAESVVIFTGPTSGPHNDTGNTDQAIALLFQLTDGSHNTGFIEKILNNSRIMQAVVNQMTWSISAIRVIGDMAMQGDRIESCLLHSYPQVLPALQRIIESGAKPKLMKEACWIVSNFFAGSPDSIRTLVDAGVHTTMFDLLINAGSTSPEVVKEAVWAIANFTSIEDLNSHLTKFVPVDSVGLPGSGLAALAAVIIASSGRGDVKIEAICLEAIQNLQMASQAQEQGEKFDEFLKELGAWSAIESLMDSVSHEVYVMAVNIIHSQVNDGDGDDFGEGAYEDEPSYWNQNQASGEHCAAFFQQRGAVSAPQRSQEAIQQVIDNDAPDCD